MGKITYKRVTGLSRPQAIVASTLPVIGSVFYTIGSCFFWPNLEDWAGDVAASLLTIGSVFFMLAPLLDYLDMWYGISEMKDMPIPSEGSARSQWLYLTQVLPYVCD